MKLVPTAQDLTVTHDPKQSLADFLGTAPPADSPTETALEDLTDPRDFAEAVLKSREFRRYIVHGLVLLELPSAIVCRLMDYAWGKPTDRIEHTGPNGGPLVTVVERVIIDTRREPDVDEESVH